MDNTQEKAVIRAPADLIMETAKAYLTTMRRNYVTQRANKENIVQKKSRTSKKCTSEKSNVEVGAYSLTHICCLFLLILFLRAPATTSKMRLAAMNLANVNHGLFCTYLPLVYYIVT